MKEVTYRKYKTFVVVTSVLVTIVSLLAIKSNGYTLIFSIPLIYLFLFCFNLPMHNLSQEYRGMLILNVLLYVRYVLTIFIIVVTKDYQTPSYYSISIKPSTIEMSMLYIIIEMISIFTLIFFGSNHFYKTNYTRTTKKELKTEKGKYGILLYAFVIISSLLAIVYNDFFLPGVISDDNNLILNENNSHILYSVFWCLKTIVMCMIINRAIEKYKTNNRLLYILEAYATAFIYVLLNISNSRINLILPVVLLFIITNEIFKKRGRIILVFISILTIGIVSTITVYKNQYVSSASNKLNNDVYIKLLSNTQEYTSNIRPVAYGLEMYGYYKNEITPLTFINDVIGSIPIVSHIVNQDNRINHYYNLYALNGKNDSLIIPMVASSRAYFSPFLSFLLTDICIVFLMFYDSRYSNNRRSNYLEAYMNLYLCFVLAYCINGNLQMIVGRLITKYVPIILLLTISKFLIFRKNGKKHEKQKSII